MKRVVLLVAFLVSTYVFMWGVTWLAGDMSRVVSIATEFGSFHSYPGVLLGGLPPIPDGNLNTPFFGAVLGSVAMMALGVLLLRTHST